MQSTGRQRSACRYSTRLLDATHPKRTSDLAAEVPLRARIIAALDGYGEVGATGPQLVAECGIADREKSGFYKAMRHLADEGAVTAIGKSRTRRYYLSARSPGDEVWG